MTLRNALLTSIWIPLALCAQTPPAIDWQRCVGGSGGDEGNAIIQTNDGGFLLAGSTENGANGWDFLIVKFSEDGQIEWQQTYGGSGVEKSRSIIPVSEGGYLLIGHSTSADGDIVGNNGFVDFCLIRMDFNGDLLWQRSIGGPGYDFASRALETADNGFIITGTTDATGGDVSEHHGGSDIWVVRTNSLGEPIWDGSYGGSNDDGPGGITHDSEGGFVIVGGSRSADGDVSASLGGLDVWILGIDGSGDLQWEDSYGGSGTDSGSHIRQTENGYVIVGTTTSSDGDVAINQGNEDIWVFNIDTTGSLIQERTYGGPGIDYGHRVSVLDGTGYLIVGSTSSNNGDVEGNHGGFYDIWALRIDGTGTMIWQRPLGGSSDDRGSDSYSTLDGGILICGISSSTNGDVTSAYPGYDAWVVKLAADNVSVSEGIGHFGLDLYPNPASELVCVRSMDRHVTSYNAEVVDVMGRTWPVNTSGFALSDGLSFNVADLPAGTYFVRVAIDGRFVALPFVKE